MNDWPSGEYLAGTIVGALFAIIGSWLPWVRKLPVKFDNGQPGYTMELVVGELPGFEGLEFVVLAGAILGLGTVVLRRKKRWLSVILLLVSAIFVLAPAGYRFIWYRGADRYAVEPGLYMVFAGGVIFLTIGLGALLNRLLSGITT